MWIRQIALGFLGLTSGMIVAGGFFAFISLLGIIPRLAAISKTAKNVMLYENCIITGSVVGAVVSLYSIAPPLGVPGLLLTGLFSGVFVGCLAVALAEIVNTIPIFARRITLRKGIPYLVYALAIGKAVGAFVHLFMMKV